MRREYIAYVPRLVTVVVRKEQDLAVLKDTRDFAYFIVGAGESFGHETQSRRRTVYEFTVERADAGKQEATVLVRGN